MSLILDFVSEAAFATQVAPSGPAPMSALPPLQLNALNGKAFYIEVGANLRADLPPISGDTSFGGGLQTGTPVQQKTTAPEFTVSLSNLNSYTASIDPSKFYVSWKIALDSALVKRDTSLAPDAVAYPSNPNRSTLATKPEAIYLCSNALQAASGGSARYFCRFGASDELTNNISTVAFARFETALPDTFSFAFPCYLDNLPDNREQYYANSPRIAGTRDAGNGRPMTAPFYENQFITEFNLRFIVSCEVSLNMKPVYANMFPYTDATMNARNPRLQAAIAGQTLPPHQPPHHTTGTSGLPPSGGGGGSGTSGSVSSGASNAAQAALSDASKAIHDRLVEALNRIAQHYPSGASDVERAATSIRTTMARTDANLATAQNIANVGIQISQLLGRGNSFMGAIEDSNGSASTWNDAYGGGGQIMGPAGPSRFSILPDEFDEDVSVLQPPPSAPPQSQPLAPSSGGAIVFQSTGGDTITRSTLSPAQQRFTAAMANAPSVRVQPLSRVNDGVTSMRHAREYFAANSNLTGAQAADVFRRASIPRSIWTTVANGAFRIPRMTIDGVEYYDHDAHFTRLASRLPIHHAHTISQFVANRIGPEPPLPSAGENILSNILGGFRTIRGEARPLGPTLTSAGRGSLASVIHGLTEEGGFDEDAARIAFELPEVENFPIAAPEARDLLSNLTDATVNFATSLGVRAQSVSDASQNSITGEHRDLIGAMASDRPAIAELVEIPNLDLAFPSAAIAPLETEEDYTARTEPREKPSLIELMRSRSDLPFALGSNLGDTFRELKTSPGGLSGGSSLGSAASGGSVRVLGKRSRDSSGDETAYTAATTTLGMPPSSVMTEAAIRQGSVARLGVPETAAARVHRTGTIASMTMPRTASGAEPSNTIFETAKFPIWFWDEVGSDDKKRLVPIKTPTGYMHVPPSMKDTFNAWTKLSKQPGFKDMKLPTPTWYFERGVLAESLRQYRARGPREGAGAAAS